MVIKEGHFHSVDIKDDREVIETDSLNYKWIGDDDGYFLIKIEDGQLNCGFVNKDRVLKLEFRGRDPLNMIKEIAERGLVSNQQHMGYIAAELMIAKDAMDTGKEYVQR